MRNLFINLFKWLTGRNRVEVTPQPAPGSSPAPFVMPRFSPARFALLPEFQEWNQSDVLEWRKFLATPTGQKLAPICGSEIHRQAMAEAAGDRATPKAFGMDHLLRFQFNLASKQTLSRVSGDQDTKPDTEGSAENDALPAEFRRSF